MNSKHSLTDMVFKLIGQTEPSGSSHVDEERYDNQEQIIELTLNLVSKLINNSKFRDRHEGSMASIGKQAYLYVKEIKSYIDCEVEE